MAEMSTPNKATATADQLPGQAFRSFVTLFLLIHLFCVIISLSSVNVASALQIKLLDTLKPYTQLLRIDLNSTRYHFTYADDHEQSHSIEIEFLDGPRQGETVSLPDVGIRGSLRRRRFQTLAQVMAYGASDGNDANLAEFAKALGANSLQDQTEGAVLVRCRRHRTQPRNLQVATKDNPRDPFDEAYYTTVYEARVWKDKSGRVNVLKMSATGEVAPLTKEGAKNGASN